MNKYVAPGSLPSYLDQSEAVRERFARLKPREIILEVGNLRRYS